MTKRKRSIIKYFLIFVLLVGAVAAYFGYELYQKIFGSGVDLKGKQTEWLYIEKGAGSDEVLQKIESKGFVKDIELMRWVAEQKNLANHIYPGRYKLRNDMSINSLIDLLRSGSHTPAKVTFSSMRLPKDLAGRATKNIMADSIELLKLLKDINVQTRYGFNENSFMAMYIPNTYEFNWATTAEEFVERMAKEYKRFWTDKRKARAKEIGLSQSEISTLASIVQAETNMAKDRPRIAGVYMNRLAKGIPLEADPTLVYALGDFGIRRVLNKHKKIKSPYNTYMNKGLPPGPILLPSIPYIDAVLNYEKHEYIFFCAKEDFSGYSNFAKTYKQHLRNAKKYQQALNKRKIYK